MQADSIILGAGLIGALLLFLLAWRRPTQALAVWVISSVVLSEYILLPDAPTLHVHISRVLLTALLLGLAAGWVPQRKLLVASARPEILIAVLTAWTIVSACWAGTIFREDGTRNVSVFITGFLVPALIFYLARSFPTSLAVSRTICILLTALLGYMTFTAFCEHFHVNSLVFPQYILDPSVGIHPERARGPVVNAAEDGGIIAILLLTALHAVHYINTGMLRASVIRWATSFTLLLFGVLALWFTETRGPWLAFAGGLLVMLWHKQCRRVVLALGVAGLFGLIVLFAIAGADLARMDLMPKARDNTSDTTEFRLDLYRESLDPFQQHPIVGWGLGTFTDTEHLFDAYGHSLTLSTAVLHDTIVAITLESGVIGGILYISFLITVSAALIRLRGASRIVEKQDFYTLCLASLTAFVINGLFVDIRYFMPQNVLVFFMAGLGLSLSRTDRGQLERYVAEPALSDGIEPWLLRPCGNNR
jgi:putative inorganic carbon (HCO3(-)) transporter